MPPTGESGNAGRAPRRRRLMILAVVLGAAVVAIVLWGGSLLRLVGWGGAAGRFNLLLITVDTLRADRLGCYGHAAARTPAIDRLASRAALFEQAETAAPTTLPSHASILTGTYPAFHGVRNNGTYRLGGAARTLAEVLEERGYRTGAVIAAYPLVARYGLAQGFEHFDDRLPPERERQIGYREKPAAEVTRSGISWLQGLAGERFFLWLHYFDPHSPYGPPSPFAEEFAGSAYDGEVAYVDQEVGKVLRGLEQLGLSDETVVVLVADHGEGLGDHGEATHGVFLYESTIRVPMILSLPGVVPEGLRVDSLVRTIDLMPTVLALLDLPTPEEVQGTSLLPLLSTPPVGPLRKSLSETVVPRENYGWSELAAIRSGRWKYILAPRPELYDLVADPGEKTNLASSRRSQVRRLRAGLDRLVEEVTRRGEPIGERQDLDAAALERLRSLGYVWSPGATGGARRPDPKERIELLLRLDEARVLYARGEFGAAIATFDEVLRADPANLTALLHRGKARVAAGDSRGAAADFEAVLASRPRSTEVLHNLASALLAQGAVDRADEIFRQVLGLEPDSPKAIIGRGLVLARQERYTEAARQFRRALDLDPSSNEARRRLAASLAATGEGPKSKTQFREALERDPADAAAATGLARILYLEGRYGEVIELMERMIQVGADTPEVRFALGNACFRTGDIDRAAAEYARVLTARPEDAAALFASGLVALKQNRASEAIALFERARAADPDEPEVHRNLAILNDEAGKDDAAIEGYRKTLTLDPGAREIHFYLGRVYARAGRLPEARAAFRAYLDGGGGELGEAAKRELERFERR